jgi:hypothetical protein
MGFVWGWRVGTVSTIVVPEMLVVRVAVLIRLLGALAAGTVTTMGRPETSVVKTLVAAGAASVNVVPSIWVVVIPVVGAVTGVPSETVGRNTIGFSVVAVVAGDVVAAPPVLVAVDGRTERVSWPGIETDRVGSLVVVAAPLVVG